MQVKTIANGARTHTVDMDALPFKSGRSKRLTFRSPLRCTGCSLRLQIKSVDWRLEVQKDILTHLRTP